MFREEAVWIEKTLANISPLQGNNLVANLGSSTASFREVIQPHIHKHIIQPLKNNNWKIINVDLKVDDGVDLVADVTKPNFCINFEPVALTICTNMLEHVEDINLVINNLKKITAIGGYILITVPYKYRKHLDPIDNMFRPKPDEIASLFNLNEVEIVSKKIIVIKDLIYYKVKKSKIPLWGYRERVMYYFGKKHAVSGILIKNIK